MLGPIQSEEDREIAHSNDEDQLWFYGTSFALPIPLLVAGGWLASRKRRGGRRRQAPKQRPARPEAKELEPKEPEPTEAAASAEEEE